MIDSKSPNHVKLQQLKWNSLTPSLVVQYTMEGMKLAELEDFMKLQKMPLLLISGENDHISKPALCRHIIDELDENS